MALGLIDKFTNFFMPMEDTRGVQDGCPPVAQDRKTQLRVHAPAALRIYVATPADYEDVKYYADYLKSNVAIIVNYDKVDGPTQQCIDDFLHGVLHVLNGASEKIASSVHIYLPSHVEVSKELYAYSIPAYVRRGQEQ